jgi:hypothetical protein
MDRGLSEEPGVGTVRTIVTMVLGLFVAAAAAIAVTTVIFVVPGDTRGIALILGLAVFVVIIRAVTRLVLDQSAPEE